MNRREFIISVGAAGMFSLLPSIRLHASAPPKQVAAGEVGLKGPFDIAFDPSGNILVTDPPGYRVVCLDSSHREVASFGRPGAQKGCLNFPKGLAVDRGGLIYVVDSNNCRIQVFDRKGTVQRVIGNIGSIGGSFATPQGVFVDRTRTGPGG